MFTKDNIKQHTQKMDNNTSPYVSNPPTPADARGSAPGKKTFDSCRTTTTTAAAATTTATAAAAANFFAKIVCF